MLRYLLRFVQIFHAQISFRSPIFSRYVSQSRAYQHQRRFPVRKSSHHSRPSSYFTVHSLYHVIRTYFQPMLRGKFHIRQRLFYRFFYLFAASFNLMPFSASTTSFAFFLADSLLSCAWIAFSIRVTSRILFLGVTDITFR